MPAWARADLAAGARLDDVERRDASARRWGADAKPCECGCWVLWRWEHGRKWPIDRIGRPHACR